MDRPKRVYRGRRKYGWIVTLVLFLLIIALMAGIWVFYDRQKYIRYEKDGLSLVGEGELSVDNEEEEDESGILAPPVTNAQVVIEMPDYSTMKSMVTSSLDTIQALYVDADKMTAQNIAYYPAILAESPTKYNALVMNIKDRDGMLRYYSQIPLVSSYSVNGTETLKETLGNLKSTGLWLVAEVSCLGDSAMAVRNSPIGLKNSMGGVLTDENCSWLDPYNTQTREYIVSIMQELKDMGFDEVLLTNVCLPAGQAVQYSQPMSAVPDSVSAISSLCRYLRQQADDIGIVLSAELDGPTLREGKSKDMGQDPEFFYKVFDRVYVRTNMDYYITDAGIANEIDGSSPSRTVVSVDGFSLQNGSFLTR
ncbi:MAG: hypothetical protein IKV79_05820 [Oscillospiraceae bacterium]|nr:hypothetical protein [Oscillospiraceae bacterium]